MTSILLLEDDLSLGETLQERLSLEGYSVEWAQTIGDAEYEFRKQDFSLAVLDVDLPDGNGFEFAKLLQERSYTPFIFVTAMASAECRLEGYELGAVEYIPKPFHLRELLLRIKHVLDEHPLKAKACYRLGRLALDFSAMIIEDLEGNKEFLTKRECQLLELLIQSSPKVVSRDKILEEVWGAEKFPSNRTVDNLIVRIRSAIGDQRAEWIRTVRGVGYQFVGELEEM